MSSEEYLFGLVDKIQAKEGSSGFEALAPAEQVFFCVWTVEAEINNGGFHQFYSNSSGDIAGRAPNAFLAIGAIHTASILEEANAIFGPEGPPTDRETRNRIIDKFDDSLLERLEEFDSAFLEYRDNLSELLAAYLRSNL
jgi:hypothetical protein